MLKQLSGLVSQRSALSAVILGTPSLPVKHAVSQRRAAVGSVTWSMRYRTRVLAVAAQDIALHVGGIELIGGVELGVHQPTPNFWRTWAAE